MAARHSTDPYVNQNRTVAFEIPGTGLFILRLVLIRKRLEGTGFRVTARNIPTVSLPVCLLDERQARLRTLQGGAK